MASLDVYLRPTPPYDLRWSALFFGRFKSDVVDVWHPPTAFSDAMYSRAFSVNERLILVEVSQEGSADNSRLRIRACTDFAADQVAGIIARVLRADDCLDEFYYAADYDSVMSKLKRRLYGLKPTVTPSVFEAIIIAISEQQISLAVATTLRSRLARHFGKPSRRNGNTYYSFPDASSLAAASAGQLRSLGFTWQKAKSIVRAAQLQTSGEVNLESLRSLPNDQVLGLLGGLPGLGDWSAQYVLARGLGRLDIYPKADLSVRRAVSHFYGNGTLLSFEECNDILSKWGNVVRYAEYYLLLAYELDKPKRD